MNLKTIVPLGLSFCLTATNAFAHGGVNTPEVLERMESMKTISEAMKRLSETSKGALAFDAEALNAALSTLSKEAAQVAPLFETRADDPKSKALPAIWEDFEDFEAKADALLRAAQSLEGRIATPDDLGPALVTLGTTCKSCHDDYRE